MQHDFLLTARCGDHYGAAGYEAAQQSIAEGLQIVAIEIKRDEAENDDQPDGELADDGAETAAASGQYAGGQESGNGQKIENMGELIIIDAECSPTVMIDEQQAKADGQQKENDGQPVHAVCVSLAVLGRFASLCGSNRMISRRFSSLYPAQPPISSSIRPQPMQRLLVSSRRQMWMQGVSMMIYIRPSCCKGKGDKNHDLRDLLAGADGVAGMAADLPVAEPAEKHGRQKGCRQHKGNRQERQGVQRK